jgi:hypothetical protein
MSYVDDGMINMLQSRKNTTLTYTHCKKIPKKQAKDMPTMPPPTIAISYSGIILLIVGFFSCSCIFSSMQIIQFSIENAQRQKKIVWKKQWQ